MAAKAALEEQICCTSWSSSWTPVLSAPNKSSPHVTTVSSARSAANAPQEAPMYCTCVNCVSTFLLSAPQRGSPQVITRPSSRIAAKARLVLSIRHTFFNSSFTAELSLPWPAWPHVTTLPSLRIAAKAASVDWSCSTFWSKVSRSNGRAPNNSWPHVTTLPSANMAAKAAFDPWTCCTEPWSRSWIFVESPPNLGSPQVITLSLTVDHKAKAKSVDANFTCMVTAVTWSPSVKFAFSKSSFGSKILPSGATRCKKPRWKCVCATSFKSATFGFS